MDDRTAQFKEAAFEVLSNLMSPVVISWDLLVLVLMQWPQLHLGFFFLKCKLGASTYLSKCSFFF